MPGFDAFASVFLGVTWMLTVLCSIVCPYISLRPLRKAKRPDISRFRFFIADAWILLAQLGIGFLGLKALLQTEVIPDTIRRMSTLDTIIAIWPAIILCWLQIVFRLSKAGIEKPRARFLILAVAMPLSTFAPGVVGFVIFSVETNLGIELLLELVSVPLLILTSRGLCEYIIETTNSKS